MYSRIYTCSVSNRVRKTPMMKGCCSSDPRCSHVRATDFYSRSACLIQSRQPTSRKDELQPIYIPSRAVLLKRQNEVTFIPWPSLPAIYYHCSKAAEPSCISAVPFFLSSSLFSVLVYTSFNIHNKCENFVSWVKIWKILPACKIS